MSDDFGATGDIDVAAADVERAEPGGTLVVGPPAETRELAAILAAAARLHPLGADIAALAVHGDHVLNPDLAPRPGALRPRDAAVLIALCADAGGQLSVIFTERAKNLSSHGGQIALPGGRIDPGESPAAAALREAHEEVALPASAVRALGLGDPYATRTGFLVVPVLGVVTRPARLVPNPGEVAAAFTVPFATALSAASLREHSMTQGGVMRRYYVTESAGRRIWGVTAGILKLVAERLDLT